MLERESRLNIKLMNSDELYKTFQSLNTKSEKFMTNLNLLKLPLKLAVMHLLSCGKVSIFDPFLVSFVQTLAEDVKWNCDKNAELGAYMID